jgi:hypothetical protein
MIHHFAHHKRNLEPQKGPSEPQKGPSLIREIARAGSQARQFNTHSTNPPNPKPRLEKLGKLLVRLRASENS